ncbi:hypothetical protein D3C79_995650 [compost metagenome]
MADTVQGQLQGARGAQHTHRHQHRHQVRQQVLGHVEAFLGAFDKGFVHLHPPHGTNHQEQHDHAKQREVAQDR